MEGKNKKFELAGEEKKFEKLGEKFTFNFSGDFSPHRECLFIYFFLPCAQFRDRSHKKKKL